MDGLPYKMIDGNDLLYMLHVLQMCYCTINIIKLKSAYISPLFSALKTLLLTENRMDSVLDIYFSNILFFNSTMCVYFGNFYIELLAKIY